jgi:hypothetical protein
MNHIITRYIWETIDKDRDFLNVGEGLLKHCPDCDKNVMDVTKLIDDEHALNIHFFECYIGEAPDKNGLKKEYNGCGHHFYTVNHTDYEENEENEDDVEDDTEKAIYVPDKNFFTPENLNNLLGNRAKLRDLRSFRG